MARPGRVKEIEQEHAGRPFEEIVLDHLNRLGSAPAVAREIGMSEQALMQWIRRHGIVKKILWQKGPSGKSRKPRKSSIQGERSVQIA